MQDGVCVQRSGPPPASDLGGFYMVGDSVSWRADDELARAAPRWELDLRPGRRLDELPGRLDWYRADHGDPDQLVIQLGTNRRRGFNEGDFRAVMATVPAIDPGAVRAALPEAQRRQRGPGRRHQEVRRAGCAGSPPTGPAPAWPTGRRSPRTTSPTWSTAGTPTPPRGLVRPLRRPVLGQVRRPARPLTRLAPKPPRGRDSRLRPWNPPTDARAAIAALQGHEAWAIIRRSTRAGDRDTVGLVGGRRRVVESLLDVPLETGAPAEGHIADRLLAIPFRQVRERGFEAHDDGTPLVVVDVETELEFSVEDVVAAIDDTGVEFADRGGFDTGDEEYGKLVEAIIHDEIGQGEGANLVIGRHYRATVADWGADKALTVLKRLLERERGAYWTFLFFTGDRYLVGASPERHVSIHGGDVRMNPISGTFRLPAAGEESGDLQREAAATSSTTRRRSTSSSWSSTRSSR